MNVNELVTALENEQNENIMNLTTKKIMELNYDTLKQLLLDKTTMLDYLKKLKDYKYVDEIDELKYGSFIRWIPLTNPENLSLQYSGIICEIKITDNGVFIVCKNHMHRHYTFKMDECLIFQKLTAQEKLILSALDHLEKNNKYD